MIPAVVAATVLLAGAAVPAPAQVKGAAVIRAADMKFDMQFLGAPEFRGRNMPSVELEIASQYIALTAQRIGLQPLMPGASYFQDLPLEISRLSEGASHLTVVTPASRTTFRALSGFGIRGRGLTPATASGGVVFLGLGVRAPDLGWDDVGTIDLRGKVVVMLDAPLPEAHALRQQAARAVLAGRATAAARQGAAAVLMVVAPEREAMLAKRGLSFVSMERGRALDIETGTGSAPAPAGAAAAPAAAPPPQIDLRHETAAAVLGIARADLDQAFARLARGERVPSREIPDRSVELAVATETRPGAARNVVAWIEGTDPVLKNEYVVLGSHHDGIGYREDAVMPGADDNISGVVAMFAIGRALVVERPRRSVVFVWHTGEEKGLWGAYYFVQHSPVPVDRISANLNMDMLCRNDPGSIYVIGSNKLSSELDRALHAVNDRYTKMTLDYTYEDPAHPDRFFFRSDHYPYIRYGIPGVWIFCGTTPDYHQPTDTEDRADYGKMERVTKLVYHATMAIGNAPALLKLDLHPEVTARGAGNMKVRWQPARPPS